MDMFPRLRSIVLGSEPLTSRDAELFKRYFSPDCVLVNRFGATETGNIAWYFLNKHTAVPSGIVPVGYAVEDAEVLLLDETGSDVGTNLIGEIAVKSAYLSSGYWRRPDLTAGVFHPRRERPERQFIAPGIWADEFAMAVYCT
jgi:non-ribosomal peptide synthetase component F